jgi:hypothetical protein
MNNNHTLVYKFKEIDEKSNGNKKRLILHFVDSAEETLAKQDKEIQRLRRSSGHDVAGIHQKLQRENRSLQAELERVTSK